MKRSFDFFDEFADLVDVEPGPLPQIASDDPKFRSLRFRARRGKPAPQERVDRLLEGSIGGFHLSLDRECDVVVEGYRRSHIMMILLRAS